MDRWENKKSLRGFTIVELLIVIVVIAILAAITIVSYNGITNKARQSSNLTTIDTYDKALRMAKIEKGDFPYLITPEQTSANYTQYQTEVENAMRAVINNQAGPSITIEKSEPGCINGNYPAQDGLREGECYALIQKFDFSDPAKRDITVRTSYTQSSVLPSVLAPAYVSTLPLISTDVFKQETSIGNSTINLTIDNIDHQEPGGVVQTLLVRGARYTAAPYYTNGAFITFYAQGDQTCGRGTGSQVDFSAMTEELANQLAQINNGVPPENQISASINYNGTSTWTQCTVLIPR